MKRFFMMSMVASAVFMGSIMMDNSVALAKDVWAYGDGQENVYVMTETITNAPQDVSVKVKKVKNNRVVGINEIIFDKTYLTWMAQTGTGFRHIGPIESSPYAKAVWNVVKPRLTKWGSIE